MHCDREGGQKPEIYDTSHFQMPSGARGISSNRFSSSPPWYISKFLVFIGFLLVPLGSLLFLRIPSGFLGFLVVFQGSLESLKVPQSSQNSFGFFGVHMVSTSSLGFLMVLYCSLGFSRNPQGTLSFLEFQGFIGYLRICQGSFLNYVDQILDFFEYLPTSG